MTIRPAMGVRVMLAIVATAVLLPVGVARGAERQFLVILANSPKQFADNGGQPPAGLANPEDVDRQYFDKINPNVDSMAEYWEEISYGDVTIDGRVTQWLSLPWPITSQGESDPSVFLDLNDTETYEYGAGEFTTGQAAVIVDTTGDPSNLPDGPFVPGPWAGHRTAAGFPVWKPGERFVDMDGDGTWDGRDEVLNRMDWDAPITRDRVEDELADLVADFGSDRDELNFKHPEVLAIIGGYGFPDLQGAWVDLNNNDIPDQNPQGCQYLPDSDNDGNPDCCPEGPGTCPRRGLDIHEDDDGFEDTCPPRTWESENGTFEDCNGNLIPDACDIDPGSADCIELEWTGPVPDQLSHDVSPVTDGENNPDGVPDECQFDLSAVSPDAFRCTEDEGNSNCVEREVETLQRCEYDDSNNDDLNIVEPFENFMRRWDPCHTDWDATPSNRISGHAHWVKVYDPTDVRPPGESSVCNNAEVPDYIPSQPDYIRNNYPGNEAAKNSLISEAHGRVLVADHDPFDKLAPMECFCESGVQCFSWQSQLNHFNLDPDDPYIRYLTMLHQGVTIGGEYIEGNQSLCLIGTAQDPGMHVEYNPPDGWTNVVNEDAPEGQGYTAKMQIREGPPLSRTVDIVEDQLTPKPGATPKDEPWYEQAWQDRYQVPKQVCDPDASNPSPEDPCDPPAWEIAIFNVEIFDDANPDTYDPEVDRRYFNANAGGLNGDGTGWVDCNTQFDPVVRFETGEPEFRPDSFQELCNQTILPDEANGMETAGEYYDGYVEFDDLPSSKYHRGGDQRLGEVTSPLNESIFGQDLGPHLPGSNPSFRDDLIYAAGPYAIDVHGNAGFDAGNVLTMELLTWRREPPFNDGVAWENDLDAPGLGFPRFHPYAGPSSGLNNGFGLGFRDYNLDGLIDLGESRFAGSENYVVDSVPGTPNNGTNSHYPFNRRRLLEDCIAILDHTIDFDDFIDEAALNAVTCGGTLSAEVPAQYRGTGALDRVFAEGLNSGIVLLPEGSPDEFPIAPSFYPIHNDDADIDTSDPGHTFPDTGDQRIHWNIFFHDLVKSLSGASESEGEDTGAFQIAYSAHEYLHSWEGFPDLYDYDIYEDSSDLVINRPVGGWDIMASGGLVHPTPILKEKSPCTEWINPVNLQSVLTPGVDTTITLPQYEFVRDQNAYFLENGARLGERYYIYSVGQGFDGRMPGAGMLILHTDVGANPDGLPSGQRQGPPWEYLIVQADGLGQLDAGENGGDAGDPWPGATGNTRFNATTSPAATWYTTAAWTGLDILDVVPDGDGSVQVTINWVPTDIPSLRFVNPPGGTSVAGKYQVNFDATDVFGGTTIRLYHTKDPDDISISSQRFIGELQKTTPGTRRLGIDWDVSGLTNGMYHVFAKLVPGQGADGTEKRHNTPVAGRNNVGNGTMEVTDVGIDTNRSRVESWTARLIDIRPNGTLDWLVNSSLTQPQPDDTDTDQDPYPHLLMDNDVGTIGTYTSIGNEVTFSIEVGSIPFEIGDEFTFTTTGITAASSVVTVRDGEISDSPRARIFATPLSGRPPLNVTFDARDSVDPFGQPLRYEWDFGDGDTATGSTVQHTFEQAGTITVTLRAINQISGLFGEAKVDINVTNNSPRAVINANPRSGPAPLEVTFNANQSSDSETSADELIYQWDFGDGSTGNPGGNPGVQIETTHFYTRSADGALCTASNPCEFTAKLTVTDAGGKSSTDTVLIRAGNTDPVVLISHTALRGEAPLEVTFDTSGTTDPDGQDLDITWRWGDGSAEETFAIEGPNGDNTFTHEFDLRSGEDTSSYQVTAVVTDSAGASTEWPGVRVTVGVDSGEPPSNDRPTASIAASSTSGVAGQTEFIFDGRDSTDPDGDTLTYLWDFGGGIRRTGATVARVFDEPGTYTVTLFVTDTSNLTDDATIQITVTEGDGNRDPLAFIGSGPRSGIAPVTLSFNGQNSYDPDGDTLTFRWEFMRDGLLVGTGTGPIVSQTFDQAGQYDVRLEVTDGRGGLGIAGPERVRVTARVEDPGAGQPPPGNENDNGDGIPNSGDQRPTAICGMGMIMSFMLMMLGLTALRLTRRREG